MKTFPVTVIAALLLTAACEEDQIQPVDTEADTAAILSLIEHVTQFASAGDRDGLFDLYTDDAVWMLPDQFSDAGKEEARSWYSFMEQFTFDQEMTVNEIQVAGDWAFARLSFDGYVRPKPGVDAVPSRGISRHMWLLRRQPDGYWKLARDIFNTPPLDDIEMEVDMDTRIASFELLSGSPASGNLVESWNCAQNEGVSNAQLWEASKTWINVMNSVNPEVNGKVYLEFPRDGRTGVVQFKFILVLDDVEARAEYWADLDDEEVQTADMAFNALATCDDGSLASSIEVTDE